jgi:hypothetical protein
MHPEIDMHAVTEPEFEALCARRRRHAAVSLAQLSSAAQRRRQRAGGVAQTPIGRVVAQAAELLRRRELAEAAWARTALPAWADQTAVDSLDDNSKDTVIIAASSSPVLCELRRRQAALEQSFARLMPGIRHLRFVVGGHAAERRRS